MRRIVTVIDKDGKSGIHEDMKETRVTDFKSAPGMRSSILWSTDLADSRGDGFDDRALKASSLISGAGGTVFMMLTLPPDASFARPDFDPARLMAETAVGSPGIDKAMAQDRDGFHTTATIDYVIVVNGEVWLATDKDEVRLIAGDVVIQNGTRHAWRNKSDALTTLAVVLIGTGNSAG